MPVGTNGTIKAIHHETVKDMGYNLILGNTYHLYLRPGLEVIKHYGSLHKFSNWKHNILTDSGGFSEVAKLMIGNYGDSDLGARGRHAPPASSGMNGGFAALGNCYGPLALCPVAKFPVRYRQSYSGTWLKLDPTQLHFLDAGNVDRPLGDNHHVDPLGWIGSPTLARQDQQRDSHERYQAQATTNVQHVTSSLLGGFTRSDAPRFDTLVRRIL